MGTQHAHKARQVQSIRHQNLRDTVHAPTSPAGDRASSVPSRSPAKAPQGDPRFTRGFTQGVVSASWTRFVTILPF